MTEPVRILHLEDDANDAELIQLHLRSQGWPHERVWVKSESEFSAALDQGGFDVILVDNAGPFFDGRAALKLAKAKRPDVPFVFLSGSATPTSISEALQNGAADYLQKDDLSLLIPRLKRILEKK